MTAFTKAESDLPLWHTTAFHDVPIFRALALALDDAQDHDADFVLFSADRRDAVIARFNRKHGTNLHGQQYLVDAHARDPAHFAPANSPQTTSHCLRSDGNAAYVVRGRVVHRAGTLPKYMLGIDGSDRGKGNDPSHLLAVLHHLGYHVVRPYALSAEAHHFVFVTSPVPVLRHRGRIPR